MSQDHKRLCGYTVIRPLGPESLLASDERGRSIVIKKLNESCLLQGRLHPAIHARLQHVRELPLLNVSNLRGVERDGDRSYLIWDYVDGRTLGDYLASAESDELKATAMREAKLAVDSLHAAGVVHGAIHGKNVIIDERGGAHLTHISPLLFHDVAIDQRAFARIAPNLLHQTDAVIASSDRASIERIYRLRFVCAAIGLAIIGIALAVIFARFATS
jgi:serine/threonine protein kinase